MDIRIKSLLLVFVLPLTFAAGAGCSSNSPIGTLPATIQQSVTQNTSDSSSPVLSTQERRAQYMHAVPVYSPTPPPPGGNCRGATGGYAVPAFATRDHGMSDR